MQNHKKFGIKTCKTQTCHFTTRGYLKCTTICIFCEVLIKKEFQVHSLFETEQKMVFLDIMWEAVECTQLWLMHLLWCKFIYGLKNFQSILLIYFPLFQLSVR